MFKSICHSVMRPTELGEPKGHKLGNPLRCLLTNGATSRERPAPWFSLTTHAHSQHSITAPVQFHHHRDLVRAFLCNQPWYKSVK